MARSSSAGEGHLEERLEKTVEMGLLYDVYGELLTEKQRRFFELYFLDDLSLGEIGQQFEVSRQAVFDILRRSQKTLERMEARLGLVAAGRDRARRLARLREQARRLEGILADPAGDRMEALALARALRQDLAALSDRAAPGKEASDGLRTAE